MAKRLMVPHLVASHRCIAIKTRHFEEWDRSLHQLDIDAHVGNDRLHFSTELSTVSNLRKKLHRSEWCKSKQRTASLDLTTVDHMNSSASNTKQTTPNTNCRLPSEKEDKTIRQISFPISTFHSPIQTARHSRQVSHKRITKTLQGSEISYLKSYICGNGINNILSSLRHRLLQVTDWTFHNSRFLLFSGMMK